MNTIFHDSPKDGGEERRVELQRQLTESLRRSGLNNIRVRIERHTGQVVFSGTEEELKAVEQMRAAWKPPIEARNLARPR